MVSPDRQTSNAATTFYLSRKALSKMWKLYHWPSRKSNRLAYINRIRALCTRQNFVVSSHRFFWGAHQQTSWYVFEIVFIILSFYLYKFPIYLPSIIFIFYVCIGIRKTITSRFLFRFYDGSGGSIKVNGTDIRDVKQDALRKAIGVVSQSAVLFNDTIEENIMYGCKNATRDQLEQQQKMPNCLTLYFY